MKKYYLLLFILSSITFAQTTDFFKEDITFYMDSTYFSANGFYWFANNSGKPIQNNIFYPFPNNSNEKIDSIAVFNLSSERYINFIHEGKHGITFDMFIEPYDTVIFQIKYRQKLNSDSAVYILRTTQKWSKPLKYSEYKLIVSKSFKINKFSYTPLKSYEIQNKKIYFWKMKIFMPLKDMIFYF